MLTITGDIMAHRHAEREKAYYCKPAPEPVIIVLREDEVMMMMRYTQHIS